MSLQTLIYDAHGRRLLQKEIFIQTNKHTYQIDGFIEWPRGYYFLQIGNQTLKLLKL